GPGFASGFRLEDHSESLVDESWEPVMGEQKIIRSNYRELLVKLAREDMHIYIRFRLFNDGLGFRYEFPKQMGLNYFVIKNELTEFNLAGDHKIFWMPGDYDTNEYPYTTSKVSEIPGLMAKATVQISAQQPIGNPSVQTPVMMKSDDGLYINIHEAALVNFPAMALDVDGLSFRAHLVPDALGNRGYIQTDAVSPW